MHIEWRIDNHSACEVLISLFHFDLNMYLMKISTLTDDSELNNNFNFMHKRIIMKLTWIRL